MGIQRDTSRGWLVGWYCFWSFAKLWVGWILATSLGYLIWDNPDRWCQSVCTVHPAEVRIPLRITTDQGDDVEVMECSTSILWPWDFFNTMYKNGSFLGWVSDDADPIPASSSVRNYWEHCSHLDFFKRLELPTNKLDTTVPLGCILSAVLLEKVVRSKQNW